MTTTPIGEISAAVTGTPSVDPLTRPQEDLMAPMLDLSDVMLVKGHLPPGFHPIFHQGIRVQDRGSAASVFQVPSPSGELQPENKREHSRNLSMSSGTDWTD